MPVHEEDGGEQWGGQGKVYHGPDAKEKAESQGRAAYANGYKGKSEDEPEEEEQYLGDEVEEEPKCNHCDMPYNHGIHKSEYPKCIGKTGDQAFGPHPFCTDEEHKLEEPSPNEEKSDEFETSPLPGMTQNPRNEVVNRVGQNANHLDESVQRSIDNWVGKGAEFDTAWPEREDKTLEDRVDDENIMVNKSQTSSITTSSPTFRPFINQRVIKG